LRELRRGLGRAGLQGGVRAVLMRKKAVDLKRAEDGVRESRNCKRRKIRPAANQKRRKSPTKKLHVHKNAQRTRVGGGRGHLQIRPFPPRRP